MVHRRGKGVSRSGAGNRSHQWRSEQIGDLSPLQGARSLVLAPEHAGDFRLGQFSDLRTFAKQPDSARFGYFVDRALRGNPFVATSPTNVSRGPAFNQMISGWGWLPLPTR